MLWSRFICGLSTPAGCYAAAAFQDRGALALLEWLVGSSPFHWLSITPGWPGCRRVPYLREKARLLPGLLVLSVTRRSGVGSLSFYSLGFPQCGQGARAARRHSTPPWAAISRRQYRQRPLYSLSPGSVGPGRCLSGWRGPCFGHRLVTTRV